MDRQTFVAKNSVDFDGQQFLEICRKELFDLYSFWYTWILSLKLCNQTAITLLINVGYIENWLKKLERNKEDDSAWLVILQKGSEKRKQTLQ